MAGTDQTPEPGSTVQSEFAQITPLIDVFNKALYRKTTDRIVLEFILQLLSLLLSSCALRYYTENIICLNMVFQPSNLNNS